MVSEQFYDHSANRLWSFKDMRILNDHIEDHDKDRIKSDHGVIRARFKWHPTETG